MKPLATILVGGMIYEGWTKVSVKRSVGDAAATFELEVSEPDSSAPAWRSWQIRPGDYCQVSLDGTLVIDGYVDSRQASYSAEEHGIQISGRSKTADLVDSSVLEDGGQFRGYKVDAIARRLAGKHGVAVKLVAPPGAPFEDEQIWPGGTVWETIERLCRMRGIAPHDNENGELVLDQIDQSAAPAGALIEGVNILSASATLRADGRFSEYHVKGQRAGTDEAWGKDASEMEASAADSGVKRYRPLLVVAEEPGDKEAMKKRADWEAAKRAGEGVEAQATAQGWRDSSSGSLWWPGKLYRFSSPMLLVDRVLLARSVEWSQSDDEGTTTQIELVPPESMTSEPAQGSGGGDGGAAGRGSAGITKGRASSLSSPSGKSLAIDSIWTDTKPAEAAR